MSDELYQQAIENWFTYHPPHQGQLNAYQDIRAAGKIFALILLELAPPGADRDEAINLLRKAVMMANAAIACGGP